jgi:predicted lipoprotein with Yx(FWY)xxD motif
MPADSLNPNRSAGRLALALAAALALTGAAAAAETAPPDVRVETADNLGPVFADAHGHTLYEWKGDTKAGASQCNADRYHEIIGAGSVTYFLPDYQTRPTCQEVWPPFAATETSAPVGDWSVITRTDGSRQWAYKGKALYTFVDDSRPGEVNGVGVGRFISARYPVAAPTDAPLGVVARPTAMGAVLMTGAGKALYTYRPQGVTKAACLGDCLAAWRPMLAPAISQAHGDWSIVQGAGGGQWAYRGKPLFTYAGDTRFGDLHGAAEAGWTLATLQAPLKPPSDIAVEMTVTGPVYADHDGRTVYVWTCVDEAPDKEVCDIPASSGVANWRSLCGPAATCAATWRPVIAPAGARPVGATWSIVAVDPTGARQFASADQPDALKVWAYRGRPLYTYVGDHAPGDMYGDGVRASVYWGFKRIPIGDSGNDRF